MIDKSDIQILGQGITDHNYSEFKEVLIDETSSNLSVYRNNYLYGHLDVLSSKYPTFCRILGEDNSRYFFKEYIDNHAPSEPNIDLYGACFGDYVSSREELSSMYHLSHVCFLDWFWYGEGQVEGCIELPQGILDLWSKVNNEEELENIEIDFDEVEKITIKEDMNNEYILVACKLKPKE